MSKLDVAQLDYTVFWCGGGDYRDAGGKEVHKALRRNVRAAGLKTRVKFIKTHCTGQCKNAPIMVMCGVQNAGAGGAIWSCKLIIDDAGSIVEQHLQQHSPVLVKTLESSDD